MYDICIFGLAFVEIFPSSCTGIYAKYYGIKLEQKGRKKNRSLFLEIKLVSVNGKLA